MPQIKQFRLPDVGEGLTEAEIVSWKVRAGDTVAVNDVVVEIETAKSLVELPSPFAGVVSELYAAEGDTVAVGMPIIGVDLAEAGESPADGAVALPAGDQAAEPGLIGGPAPGGRTSVLVGYGPRTTEARRRPRKQVQGAGAAPAAPSAAAAQQRLQAAFDVVPGSTPEPDPAHLPATPVAPARPAGTTRQGEGVLAKPPVRQLAKALGVDLAAVRATGPGGVVTRTDVETAAGSVTVDAEAATDGRRSPIGRETRVTVEGVRRATAGAMVASAFTAPHVTEFITVDVTRTMRWVEQLRSMAELSDVRVGPLLMVARALVLAVRRSPGVNASWDEAAQEIVVKHYVNVGIAAATPRGLLVPNVKNADALTLPELGAALDALVTTAREGRTSPAGMAGGTITITNVGMFGIDNGTPILNPGQAAILCLGAVREQPWVHKGKIRKRMVTQLALSFDHRMVDGELGSRFLADIAAVLAQPRTALLW